MRRALASVLFASAVAATIGCGATHKSFVRVDDVALGRVVVYRNGVAFYERHAFVKGGKLTVVVPRERVDDFLKSLTVVDATTGEALTAVLPRDQGDYGSVVEMTVDVDSPDAEVVLTYVTESPAWKPSYRLVVGKHGKVMLQAVAIVDNTSGEDWKDVVLGVGSSSAMSFHYDLWTVKNVQRQTLAAQDSFAVAPPMAQSTYQQVVGGQGEAVVANLDDSEIRRPAGHPDYVDPAAASPPTIDAGASYGGATAADDDYDRAYEEVVTTAAGSSGGDSGGTRARGHKAKTKKVAKADKPADNRIVVGAPAAPPPVPRDTRASEGDAKVRQLAEQLRQNGQNIVIEGYADPSEPDADQRSMDRANLVRNQLIDNGVPPAQVKVVNRGVVPGQAAGARVVAEPMDAAAGNPAEAEADAPPVGESHFVSDHPITVKGGSSVMASMLRAEATGEVAYLYDAESVRGNDRYAFRAVRLENPTGYTLEAGPVTVYGAGEDESEADAAARDPRCAKNPDAKGCRKPNQMIGEGLTEPIPPHANVVIPFALDRQIVVEREDDTENRVARLVTLSRGVLTAEVQHIKKTRLTITSRLREPTKVYVRHTVAKGWTLIDAPETFERIADAHLFEVDLAKGETKVIEISEATPMTRTLDLNADTTMQMMEIFVQSADPGPELSAQLKELLGIHKEMADGREKMDSLRRRLAEYRVRMDELTAQIVTLKAVKQGGDLLKHLEAKMKDISNRVQKSTIEVVDTEEKLMLAKVRFQDMLSELHLPDATQPGSGGDAAKVAGGTGDGGKSKP